MQLDNAQAYRSSAYPSYLTSRSENKTPPMSDASTTDSWAAHQRDVYRVDYASAGMDSTYYMPHGEMEAAQMNKFNQYMTSQYWQQASGNQPPMYPASAEAAARAGDAPRDALYGQPSEIMPRSPYGIPPQVMMQMPPPNFMPMMQVPFRVPPGFMLVPATENHGPPQPDASAKHPRDTSKQRGKHQRKTKEQVSKIFVGGLSPLSTVDTLREHFGKFGEIVDAAVILEATTRKSRGFGYVEFAAGIPEGLLDLDHVIDSRRCGVRPYQYNPADAA
jgi:hypothetical protein